MINYNEFSDEQKILHVKKVGDYFLEPVNIKYGINELDVHTVVELYNYFKRLDKAQLTPSKGIILAGKIGCGKTMLMNILSRLTDEPFMFVNCNDFANNIYMYGMQAPALERITNMQANIFEKPVNDILVDDVGASAYELNTYGNKIDVIEHVLMLRYELYRKFKVKTHITTNLKPNQLAERFTSRMYSRLREMCQYCVLKGNDLRI